VIVHRRGGLTLATSVASAPGETGDVTLIRRAVAVVLDAANAVVVARSAAITAPEGTSRFTTPLCIDANTT
jgi:hypothetical protein